jgi:hypothetical protein
MISSSFVRAAFFVGNSFTVPSRTCFGVRLPSGLSKGAGLQRMQLPPGNWFAPPRHQSGEHRERMVARTYRDQQSKREIDCFRQSSSDDRIAA